MRSAQFICTVRKYFKAHKRSMPWRDTIDSYSILVSEFMLQQTQVHRVVPKFESFMKVFPTIQALAKSDFKKVLGEWNGLGYNRRALWLHEAAKELVKCYDGKIPESIVELKKIKGIGHNTAAAICAYAFNMPVVFIETNIRAVFIHHFFADRADVADSELLPLIEANMDMIHPREWYWALMDYGVSLKKQHKNPARRSRHHTKQSRFEGSNRQLRGKILKLLLQSNSVTLGFVSDALLIDEDRVYLQLENMMIEGLVLMDKDRSTFHLP